MKRKRKKNIQKPRTGTPLPRQSGGGYHSLDENKREKDRLRKRIEEEWEDEHEELY